MTARQGAPEKTTRNDHVVAARAAGWTIAAIAEAAGVNKSRVRMILAMRRRREEKLSVGGSGQS